MQHSRWGHQAVKKQKQKSSTGNYAGENKSSIQYKDIIQLKNNIKTIDENVLKLENINRVLGEKLYRNNEQTIGNILVFPKIEDTEKSYDEDLLQKVLDIVTIKMSLKIYFTKIAHVLREIQYFLFELVLNLLVSYLFAFKLQFQISLIQ